jgi:putative cell wall-binding protein
VNSGRNFVKRCISIVLSCAFVLSGIATPQLEAKAAAASDGSIIGTQVASADQMAAYALSMNPSPKISGTMLELAKMFLEEGAAEGVRGDIAFAQACKETGYFAYGGTALSEWNNYSGLGVTGVAYNPGTSSEVPFTDGVVVIKNSSGDSVGVKFSEPRLGVRAQIQHLKGYATTEALKQASADPRYSLITKGRAPNWADLNGIWAVPGPNYGQEILAIYDKINAVIVEPAAAQTEAATTESAVSTAVAPKALTGLTLTPPVKKEYVLGQNLDLTGIAATGTYSDGTTAALPVTIADTSGFNSLNAGSQTITVTVDGKTASFDVNVTAKTLAEIKIAKQPAKTEYAQGMSIDLTGMEVVGTYSDGTASAVSVTKDNISGFDSSKIGSQTATVTLEGKTASFAVNIIPAVNMLSGSNITATAVEVSKASYTETNIVILATGTNFADALSAAPLAIQEKAPILLTETDSIPQSTWDEIKRLNASKAIIIGGEEEVSPSVATALKSLGISVERISGSKTFGTAVETAKRVREKSGITNKVILANGCYFADAVSIASYAAQQRDHISMAADKAGITDKTLLEHRYGFADTLSIGSYAAQQGIPILLTDSNILAGETKAALIEFGIKEVEVIGDYSVVSQRAEDELKAMGIKVARTYGSSRFGTSIEVAGKFFPDSQKAIAASGLGFADALAAVPLAAKMNAPIVFVDQDSLPSEVSTYMTNSKIDSITMVGGDSATGETVKDQMLKLAE